MNKKPLIYVFVIFISLLLISSLISSDDTNLSSCTTSDNICSISIDNDVNNYVIPTTINTSSDNLICGVYFTAIGCPHCAKIDPILFKKTIAKNSNLVVIEYEVKNKKTNSIFSIDYDNIYKSGFEVPFLVLNKNNVYYYTEIKDNFIDTNFNNIKNNDCPLPTSVYADGSTSFSGLNLNNLNGYPTIWKGDRALEKTGDSNISNNTLHSLLNDSNIDDIFKTLPHMYQKETYLKYSGGAVLFDNAANLDGWTLYWNGKCSYNDLNTSVCENVPGAKQQLEIQDNYKKLGLIKIISLALADAVNPCAFAVLLMLLLAITTATDRNSKKILLSALAFIASIFVMYFIYGLLLTTIFQSFPAEISVVVYKVFSVLAILLGIWEIKDFFNYKPGSFATEMPMGLRPKVQKLIFKATSPKGAAVIGLFVTLFLLPCTIGPYIIATNSLAFIDLLKSIPLLLLYNIIFIIPMLIITLLVVFGIKKIEDLGSWKKKNIRYMHLVAGLIIFIIGIMMLLGII